MATELTTAEEFARMRLDGPCELVHGKVLRMSPAGARHGLVASLVIQVLVPFVRERGLGLVVSSETGYVTARVPDSVRAPDVAYVSFATVRRWEAEGGTFFGAAPDLAVEVLSPGDAWVEVEEKATEYLAAGSERVWVLNPATERVTVYGGDSAGRVLGAADELDGDSVLPGFHVPVARLFRLPA